MYKSDNTDVRVPTLSNFKWKIERTQQRRLLVMKNAWQWLHTFKGMLLLTVLNGDTGYIYLALVTDEWVSIKYWWNDWSTQRRKPKYLEENLPHFHMDCPGIKAGTLR